MQIRMTETFLGEADSIEEAEERYAFDHLLSCDDLEFESVRFTEVKETEEKEKERMENRKVELTLEEYTDLVLKANDFERLKATARNKPYLSELEKVIFGLYEEPVEDDF